MTTASGRWILRMAGSVALASILAACAFTAGGGAQSTDRPSTCPTALGDTAECAVLLGITSEQPTTKSLEATERKVGRGFDIVYRFHDIDDIVPTGDERQVVAGGRVLHVSIDARVYGGETVPWSDVAAGRFDDELRQQAEGIAGLREPVFVTFEHEADQPAKQIQGAGTEFVAAWRHVHDVYTAAGATNAVWVWVMTGTADTLARAGQLWPGNDVVDWISWDVYNASGCRTGQLHTGRYQTFDEAARVFYDWLNDNRLSLGIDTSKPMMISEAGSVVYPGDDVRRTASWYASIPATLQRMPQVRAVTLWDHTGNPGCDYRFSSVPPVRRAVAKMGADPTFAGPAAGS